MDALRLPDDGLHIVVVPDDGLEIVHIALPGLPSQVQLQGGKALEAQPLGKADHRRRGRGAGRGVFLGVHMDDLGGVVQQIAAEPLLSLSQAVQAFLNQKCTTHSNNSPVLFIQYSKVKGISPYILKLYFKNSPKNAKYY